YPRLTYKPTRYSYSAEDKEIIGRQVKELLQKQAIRVVKGRSPGFYHHVFTVITPQKKRPVLNARPLNRFVKYKHFKMENLATLKELLLPQDFMVKIDLKDAYLHVPIHLKHRKLLKKKRPVGHPW